MNICIVAREVIPIPPSGYGGSERVIYDLAENLVNLGHNVYLFANEDSVTNAKLIAYPKNIKENEISGYVERSLTDMNIDIIHDNTEFLIHDKTYKGKFKDIPIVFTLHYASRYDYEYPTTIYPSYFMRDKIITSKEFDNVVYHGINVTDYEYSEAKANYLLCMGICKNSKGTHLAIELANRLDMNLKIVGPKDSDDVNDTYFKTNIEPFLNDKIQYCGTISGDERLDVLANAKALIFPTSIETFGLVALEAMASGTPVLMLDTCTGKEIMSDKFKDCVCIDINQMEEMIINNKLPSCKELRTYIASEFNTNRMVNRYIHLYDNLIQKGSFDRMENKKPTISLCMICKNEEHVIDDCLESIHDIVDEIIIVDTGSTDKTKEIVSKYTNKIYDFKWIYDFSAARNHALKHASGDYILWLDSDDIFKEDSRVKLKELKQTMDGSIDLYWMYYDYRHNHKGESIYSFQNERLFKNHRGVKWNCIIHEVLDVNNKLPLQMKTDIRVTHTSNHDNTSKYKEFFEINEEGGHKFNSREKYFYSMELYKHGNDDKCIQLFMDIINNPENINDYEMSSVYAMKGVIEMRKYLYNEAILSFLNSNGYHQPLHSNQYNIAECYRALMQFNHAIHYYKTIINGLLFKEKFANNSVYSNFDKDTKEFTIKSLLSLVMIYYHNTVDLELSERYNNFLLSIDPDNEYGIYNKQFFDGLRKEEIK